MAATRLTDTEILKLQDTLRHAQSELADLRNLEKMGELLSWERELKSLRQKDQASTLAIEDMEQQIKALKKKQTQLLLAVNEVKVIKAALTDNLQPIENLATLEQQLAALKNQKQADLLNYDDLLKNYNRLVEVKDRLVSELKSASCLTHSLNAALDARDEHIKLVQNENKKLKRKVDELTQAAEEFISTTVTQITVEARRRVTHSETLAHDAIMALADAVTETTTTTSDELTPSAKKARVESEAPNKILVTRNIFSKSHNGAPAPSADIFLADTSVKDDKDKMATVNTANIKTTERIRKKPG